MMCEEIIGGRSAKDAGERIASMLACVCPAPFTARMNVLVISVIVRQDR